MPREVRENVVSNCLGRQVLIRYVDQKQEYVLLETVFLLPERDWYAIRTNSLSTVIDDYVCRVSVFVCRIFSVHLFLLPMFTCLLRAASITNSMRHCAAYIGLTVDGADAESANDARTERVRRSVNRRTIRRLLSQRVESIRQHVLQHSDPHGHLEEELVKADRAVTENRHGVNDDDDGDRKGGGGRSGRGAGDKSARGLCRIAHRREEVASALSGLGSSAALTSVLSARRRAAASALLMNQR